MTAHATKTVHGRESGGSRGEEDGKERFVFAFIRTEGGRIELALRTPSIGSFEQAIVQACREHPHACTLLLMTLYEGLSYSVDFGALRHRTPRRTAEDDDQTEEENHEGDPREQAA